MSALEGTCLVTGATGFLASHIIQQLMEAGCRVRGTVRNILERPRTLVQPRVRYRVEPVRQLCPAAPYELHLIEATLEDRGSWLKAMEDVTWVFHVASPVPTEVTKNEMDVISPAVNATLNVLEAARDSGSVKRVVLTSCSLAIITGQESNSKILLDESAVPDLKNATAYSKSKVLAEQAAWKFMEAKPGFELVVMNPGLIIGPLLTPIKSAITEDAIQLLNHSIAAVPKIMFHAIDVRDAAAAHIAGMHKEEAAGKRFLLSSQEVWFQEIAEILNEEFSHQGYKVPTTAVPSFILKILGLCNGRVKALVPLLDKVVHLDTTMMRTMLEIHPRPVRESVIDMGYSVIEKGLVKKTIKYLGQKRSLKEIGVQTVSFREDPVGQTELKPQVLEKEQQQKENSGLPDKLKDILK